MRCLSLFFHQHCGEYCHMGSKNIFVDAWTQNDGLSRASGSLMAPWGETYMPFQYRNLDPGIYVFADGLPHAPCVAHRRSLKMWKVYEGLVLLDLPNSPVEQHQDGNVCVGQLTCGCHFELKVKRYKMFIELIVGNVAAEIPEIAWLFRTWGTKPKNDI